MTRPRGSRIARLLGKARESAPYSGTTTEFGSADFIRDQIVQGLYTRERACDTKVRFRQYDHALKAKSDLEAHGDPGKLTVYPCPFCAGFHFATAEEFKS